MARARNIKPAFFMNEDLAESNDALGRILFIGLWTIADYKGDLEWRPGRIKAQLLPYDDCDIKKLAINLDKSGFVRFYSDGEKIYLNITNFVKHQNPHKNEREGGSEIPEFTETMRQAVDLNAITINRDKSGLIPNKDGTAHADSLIPITESLLLIPDTAHAASGKFTKPTKQDVWRYMYKIGKGSEMEAEKFVDHYTANGWKVGRNTMKDWQASVRNWTKNSKQFTKPSRVENLSSGYEAFLNE